MCSVLASFIIGLDKSGYQVNIVLISLKENMLWERGATNEYHNMFS